MFLGKLRKNLKILAIFPQNLKKITLISFIQIQKLEIFRCIFIFKTLSNLILITSKRNNSTSDSQLKIFQNCHPYACFYKATST